MKTGVGCVDRIITRVGCVDKLDLRRNRQVNTTKYDEIS